MNGNRRELKKMLRKVIHAWTPPFRDSPTGKSMGLPCPQYLASCEPW